ncbi:shTK domain protein [Ancylostoma caninum]|uniref:ShTK domain protein n=1 Tax=Ancylostoma caninum TaxID=29170 RepID=A0A368FNA8_ANCCA|nr:shTK domain protein [Ancylostoma caninum]
MLQRARMLFILVWYRRMSKELHLHERMVQGFMSKCQDRHPNCATWARGGECNKNPLWMSENCRSACGKCAIARSYKPRKRLFNGHRRILGEHNRIATHQCATMRTSVVHFGRLRKKLRLRRYCMSKAQHITIVACHR